ncbi:isoaspartyl peptidase/L-asparaginase [Physcomitrium patens]|uniref:beta-aspartyl-peptidase n=1 Tax=Physcomitrium patens TaxID=3218 RepID=A0A2K1K8A4_PHYPA|nr:isoaspartyl peptidase/L-asparaginase-like [Physcomitrium patens]PNR50007.1 hypothetical protein PHYPA_011904 [Physcomitrium patens]|eukprot:XP_024383535.1 isoaspartyl peptidase/L-asparaginase-like [Physcomitrella patens]
MGVWAIALHGGAGMIAKEKMTADWKKRTEAALNEILDVGIAALRNSLPAVEAVELVVRALEDNTLFNAGKGSVLTNKGTVEMEASIMDGRSKNCGAVSGISTVVHPVSLARLVMDNSPHVYLAFDGAEEFARQQGVETVDTNTFITEENREKLENAKKTNSVELDFSEHAPDDLNSGDNEDTRTNGNGAAHAGYNPGQREIANEKTNDHPDRFAIKKKCALHQVFKAEFETVGCTAVDVWGNCAAATSTGGLVNKMSGRIGDTPIVGAGTYANHLCAVSGTGRGEEFIKHTVAKEVAAIMEYKELPLGKAVYKVIHEKLPENMGGLVAVSTSGEVAMAFNTPSMFRASAQEGGERMIGIW